MRISAGSWTSGSGAPYGRPMAHGTAPDDDVRQRGRAGADRLAVGLGLVSAGLVGLSLLTRWLAYRREVATPGIAPPPWLALFDVNSEVNVPTWFSVALLVVTGAVALAVAGLHRPAAPRVARFLGVLGLALFALSLDELTSLHERLGALGATVAGSAVHFTWVVPGLLVAGVLVAALVHGLASLDRASRGPFAVAAAVFFTGALVLETVSGQVLVVAGDRAAYLLVTAAEELCEMAGVVLLLRAVTRLVRVSPDAGGWRLAPAAG